MGTFQNIKMKVAAASLFAIAISQDDTEKSRGPIQRLSTLNRFAMEWLDDAFGEDHNRNVHWAAKFTRNSERMRTRFQQCGRDSKPELRKKRSADDNLVKIDTTNPVKAIKQITTGMRKFAFRYLQDCKKQPKTLADRFKKWNGLLKMRYEHHNRVKNSKTDQNIKIIILRPND